MVTQLPTRLVVGFRDERTGETRLFAYRPADSVRVCRYLRADVEACRIGRDVAYEVMNQVWRRQASANARKAECLA